MKSPMAVWDECPCLMWLDELKGSILWQVAVVVFQLLL